MEDKPSTSMEVNEPGSLPAKVNELKRKRSGTKCCVPFCDSHTGRNPELSFHKFPQDPKLRKAWLHWISRVDFQPNEHHRVCSKHFEGGKKTYLNNIPTVVPKCMKSTPSKPRATYKCRQRESNPVTTPRKKRICENETVKKLQSEIDELKGTIVNLRNENENQEHKISTLQENLKQQKFTVDRFKSNNANFELYTGFQNYETFKAFYNFLCPACERLRYRGSNNTNSDDIKEKSGRKRMLSPEEELFLCLSRLRCGLLEKDLANRYNISVSQVSNIWLTWLDFLRTRLRAIPVWPSRQFVDETMPANLKESYPRTRVIIDCTELFLEMPSEPRCQSATFSTYKNHNTAKGLVGISPRGDIVFVSELYAGNTSDQQMTRDCGILNLLEPGDEIMADRGFAIEGDLPSGVSLNIPPFLRNDQPQLSQQEEVPTRRIAKHRIHVERAIQRIKSFRILHQTLPLSMAADVNKIWIICSYLTLFNKPLLS